MKGVCLLLLSQTELFQVCKCGLVDVLIGCRVLWKIIFKWQMMQTLVHQFITHWEVVLTSICIISSRFQSVSDRKPNIDAQANSWFPGGYIRKINLILWALSACLQQILTFGPKHTQRVWSISAHVNSEVDRNVFCSWCGVVLKITKVVNTIYSVKSIEIPRAYSPEVWQCHCHSSILLTANSPDPWRKRLQFGQYQWAGSNFDPRPLKGQREESSTKK